MRGTVLVADDNLDLLDAVAGALEESGLTVRRATSGVELIQRIAKEGPFDIVLTDVSMPWMSGLQVIQNARNVGLSAPVVVMTGLHDEAIAAQVRALGPSVVLMRKPFELNELLGTVATLLNQKPAENARPKA